jgi:hypothetical protein
VKIILASHPSRLPRARARLDGLGIRYVVVVDPAADGPPSAIRTYRRALELAAECDRPALILQDDAIPHPQIARFAAVIAERHAGKLAALYVGSVHACRREMLLAHKRGRRFVNMPLRHFIPTVALLWPAGVPEQLLAWLDANPRPADRYQDDEVLKEWRIAQGRQPMPAVGVIPSLVRHDNGVPSLLNHGLHGPRDAMIPWDEWDKPIDWTVGW